jgi:large subunit ribosomal protein L15
MKFKKRKKTSRIRGAKTCGYGFRQKHKGHGNKGGRGMAGSGKRADHKKQKALNIARKNKLKNYFGKRGLTSCKSSKKSDKVINLKDIQANFTGNTIELKDYKVLGKGEGFKAKIIGKSASKSAIEKMKKAGGQITLKTFKS